MGKRTEVKKICKHPGCQKKAAPNKSECNPHRYQRLKNKDLYAWSFQVHLNNARSRGIEWGLTFEEFKEFAIPVDLLTKAGRGRESMHIDRKDPRYGYFWWNIQPLKNHENVEKMHIDKRLYYDWATKEAEIVTTISLEEENPPF